MLSARDSYTCPEHEEQKFISSLSRLEIWKLEFRRRVSVSGLASGFSGSTGWVHLAPNGAGGGGGTAAAPIVEEHTMTGVPESVPLFVLLDTQEEEGACV